MEYLRKLFIISFYAIIAITFVAGGFLQLIIGFPNTLLTYISIFIILFFITAYYYTKQIVILNRVVLWFLAFGFLIVLSALTNLTSGLKTVLYLLFFLLPLGVYLFFRINKKEGYISQLFINRLFLIIACVQLPLMMLQKIAYPVLVQINRSGQGIIEADIMFGTFFLKADHALGLFLLLNVFNILENNKNKEITKYPVLIFLYLAFTILYSESNISKLILILISVYSIYKIVPRKLKLIGFFIALAFSTVFISQIKKIKPVQSEIHFIYNEYNKEKSIRNFERGIAKRPQVLIAYATHVPLKIIGDGPYSYFNILKGKFTNTQHFSQIIWSYADLGILGLLLLFILLFRLAKSLDVPRYQTIFVFSVLCTYAFMTTIFGDIGIMVTVFGIFKQSTN
ncbi:hypothetical protein ACFSQP_06870 [Bizionia sediminis]|uniref:O-antigen ligase domain-containing protein n=1 Tax=Bizionia sediminis TaxID=1737064 RepID=A0ABW5KRU8_9FLAO